LPAENVNGDPVNAAGVGIARGDERIGIKSTMPTPSNAAAVTESIAA